MNIKQIFFSLLLCMAGTAAWAQTDEQFSAAVANVTEGNYRIYAEVGGTKYYLKADSKVVENSFPNKKSGNAAATATTAATEATVYTIAQEDASGLKTKRWAIGYHDVYFTNPEGGSNSEATFAQNGVLYGYKGRASNSLNYDRQVLFYDGTAYAIRSTNVDGTSWGASAYWGIVSGNADYVTEASYVWHFESVSVVTDVTPDAGYYRIYGSGSQAKSYLLADGEGNVKGSGTNTLYDGADNADVWLIEGTGGTGTVRSVSAGTYVNIDSNDGSAGLAYMSATAQQLAFTKNPDGTWYIGANDANTYRYLNFNKAKVNVWSEDANDVIVLYPMTEYTVSVAGSDAETIITAKGHSSKVVSGKAYLDADITAEDLTATVDGYAAACSVSGTTITVTPDTDLMTGRKIIFSLNEYEATGGTITIDENGREIGYIKKDAYVIYKVVPNFDGIYEAFAAYGTEKDGSSVAFSMDVDLASLKARDADPALTQAISNTGSWTPSESLALGAFKLQAGKTYYLRMHFLQEGGSYVATINEVGIKMAADQSTTDYVTVDIPNYGAANTLYANDFEGKYVYPFWRGWAWEPNYIHVENGYAEFYYNQEAFNTDEQQRRQLKGAELTCGFKTTSEGWYGFRFYLPDGKFPKDVTGSIIAQIFNGGNENSWAGHLSLSNDKLVVNYRNGLVDPTTKVIGAVEWDKWIPVVVYFKAGRNNKGQIKVWMGDAMTEATPTVTADGINLGFGNWKDDNTLDDQDDEAADYKGASLGCKFGLYVSDTNDRTIRMDDIKALEGNPTGAFETVKPTVDPTVTGIETVSSCKVQVSGTEVYNLAGQRVAQPTKGLYIINGKKIVK